METATLPWMLEMKEVLLKTSPYVSVVTVDWSEAAHPPYAQAVANIRVAGAATGYLLHLLAGLYDVPLSSVYLVGHSLGAHFMGYAGDFVKNARGEKVARITGLDPAGPYFVNTPPEVRLDPSDAEFVDVIHTDIPKEAWEINKLGHPDPIGHVDYYPNGGFDQAGCLGSAHAHIEEKKSVADGMSIYIGCNHQRSHAYFTESVMSECPFIGVLCDSWDKYIEGSCWGCEQGQCLTMGFHATPSTLSAAFSMNEDRQPSTTNNLLHKNTFENSSKEDSGVDKENIVESAGASNISDAQLGQNESILTSEPRVLESLPTRLKTVFLGTNSNAPFCAEQYRVSVLTSAALPSQENEGDVARFTITLRGQHTEHIIPPTQKPAFIRPGEKLSWLGFSTNLGSLTALQVDYEEDQGLLHALIWRFSPPTLYIDFFLVEELSTGVTTLFPFCGSRMQAGGSYVLFADKQCKQNHLTSSSVIPGENID